MDDWQNQRLTDAELQAFFDQLFPDGLAGADVLGDIAPEGWEQSPLLACFHPSLEQVLEERIQFHRNLESLGGALSRRDDTVKAAGPPLPEPTLEDVRREYQPQPVRQNEELTELVGQCLWDIFSDNHDVVAADGRVADIGSFRGAARKRDAEVKRCRAELAASNARAREEAVDRPPPTTVRAYRDVYGRDPRGWPPC